METTDSMTRAMHTCAMCGGKFPGPGMEIEGKLYCCDKCADFGEHKTHMIAAMAPKVAAVFTLGACVGYIVGRRVSRWY